MMSRWEVPWNGLVWTSFVDSSIIFENYKCVLTIQSTELPEKVIKFRHPFSEKSPFATLSGLPAVVLLWQLVTSSCNSEIQKRGDDASKPTSTPLKKETLPQCNHSLALSTPNRTCQDTVQEAVKLWANMNYTNLIKGSFYFRYIF